MYYYILYGCGYALPVPSDSELRIETDPQVFYNIILYALLPSTATVHSNHAHRIRLENYYYYHLELHGTVIPLSGAS